MVLSIIISAILVYILVMFIMHEIFRKFFHMILAISFILLAIAVAYLTIKGI